MHTYLTRQILASLMMTVLVFTFVLLIANVLKEVLPYVFNGQMRLAIVVQAIGLLIPFVWVFALPMGMLTATLLIFGRFSADQELTAVRASGVSLLALTSPILLLSLGLCGVSAAVNLYVGPKCRVAYKSLFSRVRDEFVTSLMLPEGRYVKEKNVLIYVDKNRGGRLEGVDIYIGGETNSEDETFIRAPRGKLETDVANRVFKLHLEDPKILTMRDGKAAPGGGTASVDIEVSMDPKPTRSQAPSISDMTFLQLREELRDVESRMYRARPLEKGLTAQELKAAKKALERERTELISPLRVNLHRQVAFSFACFGFTLVGIPLGIQVHRRETNIGIAIALLLVAVYYSFILVGQALDTKPDLLPHLIVWMPNFLFQAAGAVLLWRANKGI